MQAVHFQDGRSHQKKGKTQKQPREKVFVTPISDNGIIGLIYKEIPQTLEKQEQKSNKATGKNPTKQYLNGPSTEEEMWLDLGESKRCSI